MNDTPDLARTEEVEALLATPAADRDDSWRRRFYAAIPTASLAPGEPDNVVGPDGFPYASLRLPPIGEPFAAWSVALLAEWCTDNGAGLVVHDRAGEPAWVFSYGNLWSLRAFGTLDASPPGDDRRPYTTPAPEDVLVAQPSEMLLPPWARATLRAHLVAAGVAKPLVALVVRARRVPEQSLALSLPADPDAAHRLTWVLPPQFGLLDIAALGAADGVAL